MLIRANEIVDNQKRREAVLELEANVEDWKGHNILHFGELVLYGTHTVLKGEGVKEVEREVSIQHLYLLSSPVSMLMSDVMSTYL